MIISKELFLKALSPFDITLNDDHIDKFDKYAQLLIEWNQKFNLTAITDPDEIVVKHFVDSLAIMHYQSFKKGEKLIDVGTGAGFPGIPLLIANPELKVTLLDSTGKKLTFIDDVLKMLDLSGGRRSMIGQKIAAKSRNIGKSMIIQPQEPSQIYVICQNIACHSSK